MVDTTRESALDVIVIGAGHNGLTTANYLAMAGLRVCVLEQRHVVGGAAVSEQFHPGYRNSVASYVVSLLRPEVIADLQLARYGYRAHVLENSFYPDTRGDYLLITGDPTHNAGQIGKFSPTDYQSLEAFEAMVDEIGTIVADQWLKPPPRVSGGGLGDLIAGLRLGRNIRQLDADARHRLLQIFLGAPDTLIERWFDSDKVKAMVASHCLPANYASLHQPGAALTMLHHAVGGVNGKQGAWGLVEGGMGSITQAMARSAQDKGVIIRTGESVSRVLIENGTAVGVELGSGEQLRARAIAANTDPKRTFLKLVGREHLPDAFAADISVFRQESASLRMNLALSGLPRFNCLPTSGIGEHHRASIMMIESKAHIEQAYLSARAGIPANPPIIEALIPSTVDNTLTDQPGHHVMSLLCKYMPYDLADGQHWDSAKPQVINDVLHWLGKHIGNLDEILVAHQCLTPLDIERTFGMTRGDICHGRLEPDQLFGMRPHPQAAQYATPIKGLYLCGSGAHPGGGVTGAPGHNAAKRMLSDRGKTWS